MAEMQKGKKIPFLLKKKRIKWNWQGAWIECCQLHFSWFLKNHTPECNEVKAWSKTWREVKWSRTKHLETAKNSSLKVLSITTGEQGQLAWSLPGKVTVINVCYLSTGLFCQEDTSVTMQGKKPTVLFLFVCFSYIWWLHAHYNICNISACELLQAH